jgi:hypothetical protein
VARQPHKNDLGPRVDINAHVPRLGEQSLGIAAGMFKDIPPVSLHVRVMVVDLNKYLWE